MQQGHQKLEEASVQLCTIIVVGKTGNGKSSLCNAILGEEKFAIGRSMTSTTSKVQTAATVIGGQTVKVADMPDLSNMEDEQQEKQQESEFQRLAAHNPTRVVLAIRCDVRYTAELYAIYRRIKTLCGEDFIKQRLVVAFTFGDRQDRHIDTELNTVCVELRTVLADASGRYVVFDKTSEISRKGFVQNIMHPRIHKMPKGKFLSLRFAFILVVTFKLFAACCILALQLQSVSAAIAALVVGVVVLVFLAMLGTGKPKICSDLLDL